MKSHGDDFILQSLHKVCNYKNYFQISDETSYDLHFKEKFLGVDPWVETKNGIQRLTQIDSAYLAEYNRVAQIIQKGWYIKLLR